MSYFGEGVKLLKDWLQETNSTVTFMEESDLSLEQYLSKYSYRPDILIETADKIGRSKRDSRQTYKQR